MFTQRVPASALERLRIEPEFYDPEKIAQLSWMSQWQGRLCNLKSLCAFITDGTHVTPNYQERGVKFLSSTNIEPLWIDFDNVKFISPNEHAALGRAKCNPQPGDILLSKNGRIGTAAVYRESHEQCSLFVSVAMLRYSSDIDRDYVTAFLNCRGGWFQFTRASKTGVITNLHLEEIREVLVPKPSRSAQFYIAEKVRQAERLREQARNLQNRISQLLAIFNPSSIPTERIARVSPTGVLVSLNSNAYMPRFFEAERIVAGCRSKSIRALSLSVADGPFGSNLKVIDYRTDNQAQHPVIRVMNCEKGQFDSTELVWIDEAKQRELARSEVLPNDLLITKAGRIGSAAVYPEYLPAGNITSHLVRARLRSGIDPFYVAEFLETRVGRLLTERHSFKSTRPELTKTEVEDCLIALIGEEDMKEIGNTARTRNQTSLELKHLTEAAKLLVEALIEGKVTEAELGGAQGGLERGDTAADRELLSRLTRKGIDVPGEPPLFPDLDALYQTLEKAAEVAVA